MDSTEQIVELEAKHTKIQKKRLLMLRDDEGQLMNIQGLRQLRDEEEQQLSELRRNIGYCEAELKRLGLDPATMTFEDVV